MNMEKKGNRKEWVKNAAIVFLSIMLVLTFFSNTIMNYSLPEVATTMIEPGSITAKIRGTGNLSSDDPYKITIEETRVVSSVAVKAGDTVEKDQILFYLEDKESDELEKAEEELKAEEDKLEGLVLDYSKKILDGTITNEAYHNIQNSNPVSNNEYQLRINAAKQKVTDTQATVDSLAKQIQILETPNSTAIEDQQKLEDRKKRLAEEKEKLVGEIANLDNLKAELSSAKEAVKGTSVEDIGKLEEEVGQLEIILKEKVDGNFTNVKNDFEAAMLPIIEVVQEVEPLMSIEVPFQIKSFEEIVKIGIDEYLKDLDVYYRIAENANDIKQDQSLKQNLENLANKFEVFREEYEVCEEAKINVENKAVELEKIKQAFDGIPPLESKVNSVKNRVDEIEANISSLESKIYDNEKKSEKQIGDLKNSKIQADTALSEAERELKQLLTDISAELDFDHQNDLISDQRRRVEEKRKELEKIREKSIGTTIKAPVAGIVTSISITAGEKADPTRELAIMQPEGKGYNMSFSVTAEQAKKVKVGDKAEIQNSWFYNDIEATLTGIRPDPEDAGQKKLLVFEVKGDVQAGQSISLSIGQKSADYDLLVPNSAVREDNQGKFILIVESKNSPLGNRYIAKRVDVEVLGADDLKTAISAALYGYEYVITTATQPVEAGKQIRLADTD